MLGVITAGLSGMRAFGKAQDAAAHNIANAGTPSFQPFVASYTEAAGGGVDTSVARADAGLELQDGLYAPPQAAGTTSPGGPGTGGPVAGSPETVSRFPEPSEVDLAREVVDSRVAQRGYELSTRLVSVGDDLLGSLLDTFA